MRAGCGRDLVYGRSWFGARSLLAFILSSSHRRCLGGLLVTLSLIPMLFSWGVSFTRLPSAEILHHC